MATIKKTREPLRFEKPAPSGNTTRMYVKRGDIIHYEVFIYGDGLIVRAVHPLSLKHDGCLVIEPNASNSIGIGQRKEL